MYVIVGLGNPGQEYENTRHNVGRMIVTDFCVKQKLGEFVFDKKSNALIAVGKLGDSQVTAVLPETFMNKSGGAVAKFVKSKKAAETLIVVHDELDLPMGRVKISFNKSSGGHKGVESIKKSLGTEAFVRVRVGISPSTSSGKLKKPTGDEVVNNFILGKFSKKDEDALKKISKSLQGILTLLVTEGKDSAMNEWNGRL